MNEESGMNPRLEGLRRWWLPATALALVLVLNFWCQLHGSVLGLGPVTFDISLPWALKAALGWVVALSVLSRRGGRFLDSTLAARHRWLARALMLVAILAVTMGNELLLIRGEAPLALWLYERLPLHVLFASLLVGGYLLLRAREQAGNPAAAPAGAEPLLVEVMTGTGRTQVRVADIECLEADRNYINVHTPQRSYLLRQTLSSLEKSLSPRDFQRVHRSIIVNRAKIRERRSGGVLVLSSGRVVRVSRAFWHHLR
jgi:DNA-binding LytR/AlgR family response regulator